MYGSRTHRAVKRVESDNNPRENLWSAELLAPVYINLFANELAFLCLFLSSGAIITQSAWVARWQRDDGSQGTRPDRFDCGLRVTFVDVHRICTT